MDNQDDVFWLASAWIFIGVYFAYLRPFVLAQPLKNRVSDLTKPSSPRWFGARKSLILKGFFGYKEFPPYANLILKKS